MGTQIMGYKPLLPSYGRKIVNTANTSGPICLVILECGTSARKKKWPECDVNAQMSSQRKAVLFSLRQCVLPSREHGVVGS